MLGTDEGQRKRKQALQEMGANVPEAVKSVQAASKHQNQRQQHQRPRTDAGMLNLNTTFATWDLALVTATGEVTRDDILWDSASQSHAFNDLK